VRRRAWILGFIHIYLLVQVAVPLHYYAARADKNDERFAWRMFSSVRLLRCGSGPRLARPPEFRVGGRPVDLYGEFHEAWVEISRRGRIHVIEAMARELCARNPGEPVTVSFSCTSVDGKGKLMSAGHFDVCLTGTL
jgi:hypothetical protein